MGYAPPYFNRLRIYARQINYFYRKLRGLAPVYDNCPVRCLAPEADRVNGCPNCDFTIFYNQFKANYNRIVEKDLKAALIERGVDPEAATRIAKEDAATKWTFENLAEDYRALSEIEARAGTETEDAPGGIDPTWNVRIYAAIGIIREERYKVRREVNYEQEQEREAKDRAARARRR